MVASEVMAVAMVEVSAMVAVSATVVASADMEDMVATAAMAAMAAMVDLAVHSEVTVDTMAVTRPVIMVVTERDMVRNVEVVLSWLIFEASTFLFTIKSHIR